MNKKQYQEYLRSDYWKYFRDEARLCFGNKCWFCGRSENLNLHHLRYYKKTFYSNRMVKNNLRWFLLVCNYCHYQIHQIAKEESLEPYKATKEYRNRYFPNKRVRPTKKIMRENRRVTKDDCASTQANGKAL